MEYEMEKTITTKKEKIKSFCDNTLTRRFRIPVKIDDATARVIAYYVSTHGYGGENVWLGKETVKRSDLQLRLVLEYPREVTTR